MNEGAEEGGIPAGVVDTLDAKLRLPPGVEGGLELKGTLNELKDMTGDLCKTGVVSIVR